MHKFLSVFLLLAGLARPQLSPCETYACDSTVVQSILDANGLSQFSPVDVTQRDTLSGRIIFLSLNRGDDLTGVKTLPNEVGRLTALRKLWLADQDIKEFPRGIGQLTLLEDLILHGNMLESLPDEIKNLTRLRRLVLSGNPLKAFPPAITGLKELHYLSVGGGGVDSVPDDLWGLTALTELSITNTSMSTLPGAVAGLSNLKSLTLSGNRLQQLPRELAELKNLMFLLVDNNQISVLPDEIATLDLYHFSLSNNEVCEISTGLEEWVDHRTPADWRNTQSCIVDVKPMEKIRGLSLERQTGRLLLRVEEGLLIEADLYDALGKKASGKLRVTPKSTEWFIGNWQPGAYYLRATFEGKTIRRKVVIAH